MTQEYEDLREGLLALLCVGDEINYLHSGMAGYNQATHSKEPYHTLLRYRVTDVISNDMIKIESFGYTSTVFPSSIEVYDGELYIWSNAAYASFSTREEKVAKMSKIIEAKMDNIDFI